MEAGQKEEGHCPEGGGRRETGTAAERGEPQSLGLYVPQDRASGLTSNAWMLLLQIRVSSWE